MIIYPKHYQQLCNRIWSFLPALSYALHYNKNIIILWAFGPYVNLFPKLREHKFLHFYFEKKNWQYRRLIIRFWKFYDKYLLTKSEYRKISKWKPVIFSGAWESRNDLSYVLEEKDKIRDLFSPSQEVWHKINSYFNDNFIYVGVHIRRGDYKEFNGGAYFYDISYYYRLMDSIKSQMINNNVRFFISSNEDFDEKELKWFEGTLLNPDSVFRIPNAKQIDDLYALSKCAYIIGPPSTFSQWAAFYGDSRLKFIDSKNLTHINISSFKRVVYLDKFE